MNCLPWVSMFHRSIDLDGAWRGWGWWWGEQLKTLLRPLIDGNTRIVCVMHSGVMCSFSYTISFYIGLIMLISMPAPRNGSTSLFKRDLQLLGLFWWWKDTRQWTRLRHPVQTSPSTECLRLHFGTLCWCQALFEGIVEIANAACTPLRPSSLQLDIACIPNVNMAEWWSGTCCTTSCYSPQPALPAQVNCPLSTIIKALLPSLSFILSHSQFQPSLPVSLTQYAVAYWLLWPPHTSQ